MQLKGNLISFPWRHKNTAFWADALSLAHAGPCGGVQRLSLLRPLGPDLGPPNPAGWTTLCTRKSFLPDSWEFPHLPAPTNPQSPLQIVNSLSLQKYLILYTLKCHGFGYSISLPRCGGIHQDVSSGTGINMGRGQKAQAPQCHADSASCPFAKACRKEWQEAACHPAGQSPPLSCLLVLSRGLTALQTVALCLSAGSSLPTSTAFHSYAETTKFREVSECPCRSPG